MNNFEFFSPTRFVFGRQSETRTGELVREFGGTKALLHFGGGSVKANGVYGKVTAALETAQDWSSHGIEHELSALYDCAHGAGLAVVMPAWMEFVVGADPARFARFAERVWGVVPDGDVRRTAAEGITRYRAWLKSIGMPSTLAELGGRAEDILRLTCHRPQ